MKRIAIYTIIIVLVFFAPVDRVDVGNLRPVELVWLYRQDGEIVLQTDTEDVGRGADIQAALEDMHRSAPAVIYLDTAKYLLVDASVQMLVDDLRDDLNSRIRVCLTKGTIDLKTATKFLEVHGSLPKLKQWNPGDSVTVLTTEN